MFYDTFEDLFENHSIVIDDEELIRYSKNWHKPAVSKDLAKYDNLEDDADTKVEMLFQPRGAQIEALYALEDSRAEGATKGLVQADGSPFLIPFSMPDGYRLERSLTKAGIPDRDLRERKNRMSKFKQYRNMKVYEQSGY